MAPLIQRRSVGLMGAVQEAVDRIDLTKVMNHLTSNPVGPLWGMEKALAVEGAYREFLSQLMLTFEGVGLVNALGQDIATFWQAHILVGNYLDDSGKLCQAVKFFERKSFDEKFPEQTD